MATEENSERKAEALKRIAEANSELAKLQRARFQMMSLSCAPLYRDLGDARRPSELSMDSLLLQLSNPDFDPSAFSSHGSAVDLEVAVDSFAKQLRLMRKRVERNFDVFLSYNSEDRAEVRTIAKYLRSAGLLAWLDEEELRPGQDWLTQLQNDVERMTGCAVVIGKSGIGPWQELEVKSAIQLFVDKKLPVVPLVLPTCKTEPQLPIFLQSFGWVDFRNLDPDPITQLVRAIQHRDA